VQANGSAEVSNWKTLEQKIAELRSGYGGKSSSPLLFRGQANSEWPLTTTLERSGQREMLFREFYQLITARIGPAVETFTGLAYLSTIPITQSLSATLSCFWQPFADFLLSPFTNTWSTSAITASRPHFLIGRTRPT
jgi:hypothetical protein